MNHAVSHDDLMRFLDGELPPEERSRIDAHLASCTECRREFAIFEEMKRDFAALRTAVPGGGPPVWEPVRRRLVQPLGWVLVIVGALLWIGYAVYQFLTSPVPPPVAKVAQGALWIGLLLLLASVAVERYRAWKTDPYREVQK